VYYGSYAKLDTESDCCIRRHRLLYEYAMLIVDMCLEYGWTHGLVQFHLFSFRLDTKYWAGTSRSMLNAVRVVVGCAIVVGRQSCDCGSHWNTSCSQSC